MKSVCLYCDTIIDNLDKIHTTNLGIIRIRRNLNLEDVDVVKFCKDKVLDDNSKITRQGKNYYIKNHDIIITINAYSYTIITAHRG